MMKGLKNILFGIFKPFPTINHFIPLPYIKKYALNNSGSLQAHLRERRLYAVYYSVTLPKLK